MILNSEAITALTTNLLKLMRRVNISLFCISFDRLQRLSNATSPDVSGKNNPLNLMQSTTISSPH